LPSGTYYVRTSQWSSYLDQIYDGINCGLTCPSPSTGTPVILQQASTVVIDFALVRSGVIRGRVTAAGAGTPLGGAQVSVSNGSIYVWSGETDVNGAYATSGPLPSGTYYVSSSSAGYLTQIYRGISCGLTCPALTVGTAVNLEQGTTRSGIDFVLIRGGAIRGTVTAVGAGTPVVDVRITIVSASGEHAADAWTGSGGGYATTTPLPTGTYFATTWNRAGYLDQVYSGVNCGVTCPAATNGTPIEVTQSATTQNIDFALLRGGAISGVVTAAKTGAAVPASISIVDSSGRWIDGAAAGPWGANSSNAPLPTGNYFLVASAGAGYLSQIYRAIDCRAGACPPATTGTAVAVTQGATSTGIDFALASDAPAFTDHPIVPGGTTLKAIHIVELREAVATLRWRAGLTAVTWTDPALVAGATPVKAVHLSELRAALNAVYVAAGRPAPAWNPAAIVSGETVVTAASIMEIRAAIIAIW
jgi:hypothetical protein